MDILQFPPRIPSRYEIDLLIQLSRILYIYLLFTLSEGCPAQ
jgi:hypothetical protein